MIPISAAASASVKAPDGVSAHALGGIERDAMQGDVTYPVQVLREHTTAIEAALSVCLADPRHKPVHRLRTEARRVEAQLLLLAEVPSVPEHREEATDVLKELRKLRRAAGKIRDLDVHLHMLEDFAPGGDDGEAKRSGKGKARRPRRAADNHGSSKPEWAGDLAAEAAKLHRHLRKERKKAAAELQKLLKKRQVKAAKSFESLWEVLKPAADLAVPAADLLGDARAVLRRERTLGDGEAEALSEKELHRLRKAAKAARYLAETLPENAAVAEAARKFATLQDAGGKWHDALELARTARRFLGKKHDLTRALEARCESKLARFREDLQESLTEPAIFPEAPVPGAPVPEAPVPEARRPSKRRPARTRKAAAPSA